MLLRGTIPKKIFNVPIITLHDNGLLLMTFMCCCKGLIYACSGRRVSLRGVSTVLISP